MVISLVIFEGMISSIYPLRIGETNGRADNAKISTKAMNLYAF